MVFSMPQLLQMSVFLVKRSHIANKSQRLAAADGKRLGYDQLKVKSMDMDKHKGGEM